MSNPLVDIVILNWNSWQDTIACLQSLQDVTYENYRILLIDNGSDNDSVTQLLSWITTEDHYAFHIEEEIIVAGLVLKGSGNKLLFFESDENVGFARGCNLGINYSDQHAGDLVLLLNNDTVVTPNFLDKMLVGYSVSNRTAVVVPQIRYFDRNDIIWNCGGKIFAGFRKYYYKDQPYKSLPDKEVIPISFFTGCTLLFDPGQVGVLTNKFFFGEEDFELSLRIKKLQLHAVCTLQSIIYHKVGTSISTMGPNQAINKILVYYLNRFINLKNHWSGFKWQAWRWLYRGYILRILRKQKISKVKRGIFINKLFRLSEQYNSVDKELFLTLMKSDELN